MGLKMKVLMVVTEMSPKKESFRASSATLAMKKSAPGDVLYRGWNPTHSKKGIIINHYKDPY